MLLNLPPSSGAAGRCWRCVSCRSYGRHVNCPDFGGTVPILALLSRCPDRGLNVDMSATAATGAARGMGAAGATGEAEAVGGILPDIWPVN